jgi:glycosyltransferase involved in cell wall biosynthesis
MPLVSVVVPTHNRPEILAEALSSVRRQTFTDYDIIVVSNGETPELRSRSQAIATLCGAWWFALPEGNVSAARNFGVEQAKGEWTAFLDDDDIWLPNKLELQIAELRRTSADMVACDYIEFDHHHIKPDRILRPGIWGGPEVENLSHMRWWAVPSAVVARTEVLRRVKFDPAFENNEDMDLLRRFSWRHRIHQMDGVALCRIRRSHPSLTRRLFKALRYEILYFRKAYQDTPSDLRWALPSMPYMVHRIASTAVRIYAVDQWTGNSFCRAIYQHWRMFSEFLRPRMRWIALRYQLRAGMRAAIAAIAGLMRV